MPRLQPGFGPAWQREPAQLIQFFAAAADHFRVTLRVPVQREMASRPVMYPMPKRSANYPVICFTSILKSGPLPRTSAFLPVPQSLHRIHHRGAAGRVDAGGGGGRRRNSPHFRHHGLVTLSRIKSCGLLPRVTLNVC